MTTLSHPAAEAATSLLAGFDGGARPVAVIDRDPSFVPVLVETGGGHRMILFVGFDGTAWSVLGRIANAVDHPDHTRAALTVPYSPINRLYGRWHPASPVVADDAPVWSWYAVTGYVAADAVAVTLDSAIDTVRVDADPDGLVFAAVRLDPTGDTATLTVHLADGRTMIHPDAVPA